MKKFLVLSLLTISLTFTACKKDTPIEEDMSEIEWEDEETESNNLVEDEFEITEREMEEDGVIRKIKDFGTRLSRDKWNFTKVPKELPPGKEVGQKEPGASILLSKEYEKVEAPEEWHHLSVEVKGKSISDIESSFLSYMEQVQVPWTLQEINKYKPDSYGNEYQIVYRAPVLIVPQGWIAGETLEAWRERAINERLLEMKEEKERAKAIWGLENEELSDDDFEKPDTESDGETYEDINVEDVYNSGETEENYDDGLIDFNEAVSEDDWDIFDVDEEESESSDGFWD